MEYQVDRYNMKDLHYKLLEMLKEIDRVCNKYNIRFILDSGSMLGAIRHQGFIPWDDDLDIAMMRDDYIKFTEVINNELGSKYRFQCLENTEGYPYNFGKVFDVDTIFVEKFTANQNILHCVYIDVFPMDYVDIKRPCLLNYHREMISKYTMAKYTKLGMIDSVGKRKLAKLLSLSFINNRLNRHMMYFYKKGEMVQKICHYGPNKPPVNISTFIDVIRVPFEDTNMPVSRDFDEVLRGRYGDYMKLPPEEKRNPAHNISEVKI